MLKLLSAGADGPRPDPAQQIQKLTSFGSTH